MGKQKPPRPYTCQCSDDEECVGFVQRPDGSLEYTSWRRGRKRHREDGPARIWYRRDGTVKRSEWWIDGVKVDPR